MREQCLSYLVPIQRNTESIGHVNVAPLHRHSSRMACCGLLLLELDML